MTKKREYTDVLTQKTNPHIKKIERFDAIREAKSQRVFKLRDAEPPNEITEEFTGRIVGFNREHDKETNPNLHVVFHRLTPYGKPEKPLGEMVEYPINLVDLDTSQIPEDEPQDLNLEE